MNRRARFLLSWLAVAVSAFATMAPGATMPSSLSTVYGIGQVTWHAQRFVGLDVVVSGFLLKREIGYAIMSDETRGGITVHDLPVTGPGIDQMRPSTRYVMKGKIVEQGVDAINGNPYHLELTAPPEEQGKF